LTCLASKSLSLIAIRAACTLPSGRAFSMAITVLAQGGGRQLLAWKDE
jgi:hypothetical protein